MRDIYKNLQLIHCATHFVIQQWCLSILQFEFQVQFCLVCSYSYFIFLLNIFASIIHLLCVFLCSTSLFTESQSICLRFGPYTFFLFSCFVLTACILSLLYLNHFLICRDSFMLFFLFCSLQMLSLCITSLLMLLFIQFGVHSFSLFPPSLQFADNFIHFLFKIFEASSKFNSDLVLQTDFLDILKLTVLKSEREKQKIYLPIKKLTNLKPSTRLFQKGECYCNENPTNLGLSQTSFSTSHV